MATEALISQVKHRWQDAFVRLNRDAQGISGLLSYSEVCAVSAIYATNVEFWLVGVEYCFGIFETRRVGAYGREEEEYW